MRNHTVMSVTQKEIAEKLNVSQSLVARALKGESRVSQATREKIEKLAQELGYEFGSNQAARSLAARRYGQRARTGVIAVTFPPMDCPSPRRMPFFVPFLEGVENQALKLDLEVYLCLARPESMPRLIREGVVDGVISLSAKPAEVAAIRVLGIPTVTYQAWCDDAHSVRPDDEEGAYLATRHLVELGHRNIAFLGVKPIDDAGGQADILRFQGYKKMIEEARLPLREEWIDSSLPLPNPNGNQFWNNDRKCASSLGWQKLKYKSGYDPRSNRPFSAVVCHNDTVAMGLVRQIEKDGLQVPRDLSVTGFDDTSHEYHFAPRITSIGSDRYEAGCCAIKTLYQAINHSNAPNENDASFKHHIFPVSLEVHQSTTGPME